MDFSSLFWLDEAERAGALRVLPENRHLDATSIAQGVSEPPTPCCFRYDFGKKPYDLMTTGAQALVLCHS